VQGDIRDLEIHPERFYVILAAAVLHHLREESEWEAVFSSFHRWLKPGGSVWIVDLVDHTNAAVSTLMWRRYGEYLVELRDEDYRDHVFAYIEQEDTPRSLSFQLDMLRRVGFNQVEVLHKKICFAAFGALKG
jgi:tRNA (cmo5U34)-methyltransferase